MFDIDMRNSGGVCALMNVRCWLGRCHKCRSYIDYLIKERPEGYETLKEAYKELAREQVREAYAILEALDIPEEFLPKELTTTRECEQMNKFRLHVDMAKTALYHILNVQ